jgi:hypothetical protein
MIDQNGEDGCIQLSGNSSVGTLYLADLRFNLKTAEVPYL